jgi:lysozyme
MLRGGDFSSNNGNVNFGTFRAEGNDFAIMKATGGIGYPNPLYLTHIRQAREAGLLVGHYHYGVEKTVPQQAHTPEAEAQYFLDHADVRPGESVWLDMEDVPDGMSVASWANRWLEYVAGKVGFTPGFYSYPNYMLVNGLLIPSLAKYPLWFAYYRTPYSDTPWPVTPRPWTHITIWQWSGGSQVAATSSPTDLNVFDGTRADFQRLGKPMSTITPETNDIEVTYGINERGQPWLHINFKGQTNEVLGVDIQDAGMTVRGMGGEKLSRSVVNNQQQPWVVVE